MSTEEESLDIQILRAEIAEQAEVVALFLARGLPRDAKTANRRKRSLESQLQAMQDREAKKAAEESTAWDRSAEVEMVAMMPECSTRINKLCAQSPAIAARVEAILDDESLDMHAKCLLLQHIRLR